MENLKGIQVLRTNSKDIDSVNIEIYKADEGTNKHQLIGEGSYNIRTNFAHLSLFDEFQDLESDLVDAIEERTIELSSNLTELVSEEEMKKAIRIMDADTNKFKSSLIYNLLTKNYDLVKDKDIENMSMKELRGLDTKFNPIPA